MPDSSTSNKRKRAKGEDENDLQPDVRELKKSANTTCYLQILGNGMDTQDTSPSVFLFFDQQRFIFNAGEGLQRFCMEHNIKLSQIHHILLSRVCSETAGGLPGILLSLAAEGKFVNVWGPPDLKYLVDAMKSFVPNAALVHTHSFGPDLSNGGRVPDCTKSTNSIILVDNEFVRISAFLLNPGSSKGPQLEHLNGMHKPCDISVVYVCELPEISGEFDPDKAAALGLRPGSKRKDLKDGKSVKSDDQDIMIHPSDVMAPPIPGPIFILVHCPTESHVSELLAAESLTPFYANIPALSWDYAKTVYCVIHLTPSSISKNTAYQKWMKKFGTAQHIMAGPEMKNVKIPILTASARFTARLNHMCPYIFPSPGFWPCHESTEANLALCEGSDYLVSVPAENLLKFHLRPIARLGLDRSSLPGPTDPSRIIDELRSQISAVDDAARKISQLCDTRSLKDHMMPTSDNDVMIEEPWLNGSNVPACLENITREDMEIVLLGTGSSQPSNYRNVSSIYINLFSKGSLLLDCGEGTLGQLKRRYGLQSADDGIRGLMCIWISHIHADHHSGLARILVHRSQLLKNVPHESLLVIGPGQLKLYLDKYQRLEDLDMQFLDCKHTTEASLSSLIGYVESNSLGNGNTGNDAVKPSKTLNVDSTLFSKGRACSAILNRPNSPSDIDAVIPVLKSLKQVLGESGIESLSSVPVIHCHESFGVVIKAANRTNCLGKMIPGWKLVYSGDTRPCEELIEAARGATVLIHEATFEDALVDNAWKKNHSTTREAIKVGEESDAYRIILTHFSQRYSKVSEFDEVHSHMHNTCIGFDLMSINIADLPVLPMFSPYLKLLFPKDDEPEKIEKAT